MKNLRSRGPFGPNILNRESLYVLEESEEDITMSVNPLRLFTSINRFSTLFGGSLSVYPRCNSFQLRSPSVVETAGYSI